MAENTEKEILPEEDVIVEETAEEAVPEDAVEEPVDEPIEDVQAEAEEPAQDEKVAQLTDRLLRSMAEFENYRKRTEKEKAAQFEMGARSVVEKILPIIDNFERGLAHVDPETQDPFVAGMTNVYRMMLTELEAIGVKAIEAVGQPFDPNRHNAVMHVEDETVGENIVVEEFQKGYTYRDSVVRYSMVKVAN